MQDIWELVALHVRFGSLAQVVPLDLRYVGAIKIQRRFRERLAYFRRLQSFVGQTFWMRCAVGKREVVLTNIQGDCVILRRVTTANSVHYFFMGRREFFFKVLRGNLLSWDDAWRL